MCCLPDLVDDGSDGNFAKNSQINGVTAAKTACPIIRAAPEDSAESVMAAGTIEHAVGLAGLARVAYGSRGWRSASCSGVLEVDSPREDTFKRGLNRLFGGRVF